MDEKELRIKQLEATIQEYFQKIVALELEIKSHKERERENQSLVMSLHKEIERLDKS